MESRLNLQEFSDIMKISGTEPAKNMKKQPEPNHFLKEGYDGKTKIRDGHHPYFI